MARNTEPKLEPTPMLDEKGRRRVVLFSELTKKHFAVTPELLQQYTTPNEIAQAARSREKQVPEGPILNAAADVLNHEDDYDVIPDRETKAAIERTYKTEDGKRDLERRRVTRLAVYAGEVALWQQSHLPQRQSA